VERKKWGGNDNRTGKQKKWERNTGETWDGAKYIETDEEKERKEDKRGIKFIYTKDIVPPLNF